MGPDAAGKSDAACRQETIAARIDEDTTGAPIGAAPTPQGAVPCDIDTRIEPDVSTRQKANTDRYRELHRRIGGIGPRPVSYPTPVDGDANRPRLRRRDRDRLTFGGNDTVALRRGLEVTRGHREMAQALYGRHHLTLLRNKGRTQTTHPIEPAVQYRQHFSERHERHHARIPTLGLEGFGECVALECAIGALRGPARRPDHPPRGGGRQQGLTEPPDRAYRHPPAQFLRLFPAGPGARRGPGAW